MQWLYYTVSCSEAVWILSQYRQEMHVFYSVYLSAFSPKGWNVGHALIFIQVNNMHAHEMWEMPQVITEILVWENIQLQRNKSRFKVRNCQNMRRDMLKNSFPIFLLLRILRASLIVFETAPPIPEKAARRVKDNCIRKSHPLGGREVWLLSQ